MSNTQKSRIVPKRSTVSGETPTVAPTLDHTDGTWTNLDIYAGEIFANLPDTKLFWRSNTGITQIAMQASVDALSAATTTAELFLENSSYTGSTYRKNNG